MAAPADSIESPSNWRLLFEPTPGRFAFALRLALICTLTTLIAEIYQTPEIALTAYVAFFMNKADRMTSMLLTVAFTIVASIAIAFLLLVATPVLASPARRVLAMSLISLVILFLASASKLKPLASTVGLVLAYALDVLGSLSVGELATRALLYAWLFVAIPALASIVINLLLAPAPRALIQLELARRMRSAGESLEHPTLLAGSAQRLSWADSSLKTHLKLAALEKTSTEEDIRGLASAGDCTVTILTAVQLMLDAPEAMPSETVKGDLVATLHELAEIFESGGYPAKVAPISSDDACSELSRSTLAFLNRGLIQLGEIAPESNTPEAVAIEDPSSQSALHETSAPEQTNHSTFFAPDAFSNPMHIQFALKVTGAAMFCYLTYSLLSWSGIHTAMITCFIVSLGTAAESVEKLLLRIMGCLVGAGLGILVMLRVIPLLTDISGLLVVVFMGALLGAWVAGGDEHISYSGFQIAFAFFLCVIQGSSPAFDMTVARDRVIGILLGNLVSYVAVTQIWPVGLSRSINEAVSRSATLVTRLEAKKDEWEKRRTIAEAAAILTKAKENIRLVRYEPASIRPSGAWIRTQLSLIQTMEYLEPPLLGTMELFPDGGNDDMPQTFKDEWESSVSTTVASGDEQLARPLKELARARWNQLHQTMKELQEVGDK